jgi:hypothetical protein
MIEPVYKYRTRGDFEDALEERAESRTEPPGSEPVYWNKCQSTKVDENYKVTVMW